MRLSISNSNIFPSEVIELLRALHKVDFFEESALIGSWVTLKLSAKSKKALSDSCKAIDFPPQLLELA